MARVTSAVEGTEAQPASVVRAEAQPGGAAQAEPEVAAADFGVEPALRVRTTGPSRRRAGIEFGQTARDLRLVDLSEEQVERLLADPVLMVERVAIPVAAPSGS